MKSIPALKALLIFACALVQLSAAAQRAIPIAYDTTATINYVRTWEAVTPDTIADHFHKETSITRARMSTQYMDGLGRPIQIVLKSGSLASDSASPASLQSSSDLVSALEYDAFGRESFTYLPFASNSTGGNTAVNDGSFKKNPFAQQAAFYSSTNGNSPIKGQEETFFYSSVSFEPSSMNRPMGNYAPGNSWIGAGRGKIMGYAVNSLSDSVRIWVVSTGSLGVPLSPQTYSSGQLSKMTTTDEQGNQVIEYQDKGAERSLKKCKHPPLPAWATSVGSALIMYTMT